MKKYIKMYNAVNKWGEGFVAKVFYIDIQKDLDGMMVDLFINDTLVKTIKLKTFDSCYTRLSEYKEPYALETLGDIITEQDLIDAIESIELDTEYVVAVNGSKYSFGVSENKGMLGKHFAFTATIIVNDEVDSMDYNYCKSFNEVTEWIKGEIL